MNQIRSRCIIGLLLMISFSTGYSQDKLIPEIDITVPVKIAVLDNIDRLYIVTTDNAVVHFDKNNQEKFRYANRRSGEITHINVSNPIKIAVYCKDFGQVIILDNTLSLIQEINLFDFGFSEISAVGVSNDDSFWIYDPLRFRLLKINNTGKVLFESANILDFGIQKPVISQIAENGNRVILQDQNNGFHIFDNFGQFIKTVKEEKVKSFRFNGKTIVFFSENKVILHNIDSFDFHTVFTLDESESETVKDVLLSKEGFLKVYSNGISRIKE